MLLLPRTPCPTQDSDVPVFRSVVEQEFPEPEVEDKDHEGLALRLAQAARTLGLHVSRAHVAVSACSSSAVIRASALSCAVRCSL